MALIGSPYTRTDGAAGIDLSMVADHPWAGITTKERQVYFPVLRDVYRMNAVFGQYITYKQNLGDRNTKTMTVTSLYDIHANFDRLGLRDMSLPASYVDSKGQDITFERYGGKVAYHVYDEIITYWQYQGGNLSAVRRIVQDKLGQHMIDVQDMLARNAMLSVPFKLYGGDATNFNTLAQDDAYKVSTNLLNEIHLGMKYRGVPYAQTGNGSVGTIVCITSPGVIFDLQSQTDPKDWLTPMAYADPSRLLNYEVGTYRNIRFVESPKATLFNAGAYSIQATVTSAINAGDGAPDPTTTLVDSTFAVGQPAATHYIQLDSSTDMTAFSVNDIVSVHAQRTSNFGVTNGVDFRDGKLSNRRIVTIDSGNHRLSFDQPIMIDFDVNLGGGVYAYVTKGIHVHAAIFIGGPNGIVMGVGRPPVLHAPRPVDDFDSVWRYSWDSYQGYVTWEPSVLEVAFFSGSFRQVGPMLAG